MAEMVTRCDVELPEEEDGKKQYVDTLRTALVGWDDFHDQERQYADWMGEAPIFERGEWTEEHLRALGLRVELVTRKARRKDVGDGASVCRFVFVERRVLRRNCSAIENAAAK